MININIENIKEKLNEMITKISETGRQNEEYQKYEDERYELEQLTEKKLHARYVSVETNYKFKKDIFTVFIVAIILATVTGVWSTFLNIVTKLLQLMAVNGVNSDEIGKIGFIISLIVLVISFITILIILIMYLRNLYNLYRQLLIIKEVVKKTDNSGDETVDE